jgi:multicomponent Na+:H+ antiporter subunit B
MTQRLRLGVFLVGAAGLAALLVWGMAGLPDFGQYQGVYAHMLDSVGVPERHATNVVNLVNFDYRALDTMGEEFIFFVSVVAVAVLLREQREGERPAIAEEPATSAERTSDALRVSGFVLMPATLLLGLYIITHGHLSPGGGFQGGVVVVAGVLLIYLAGEPLRLRRGKPIERLELVEGLSAAAFVLVGVAGLVLGAALFDNFLPLGPVGGLLSGGQIPVINLMVGIEIAAGLMLIVYEFLEETLLLRNRGRA